MRKRGRGRGAKNVLLSRRESASVGEVRIQAAPAFMQILEEKLGDIFSVTISGHLDSATAPLFEAHLLGGIARGERRVLVDCAPLGYVNSAGLKVFLLAAKRLEAGGGQLVLCALAPSVLLIFEMIGFSRIMKIVPAREEALRSLRGEETPA